MEKYTFLFLILLVRPIYLIRQEWREYPTCKYGRLQSPINLNEYDSTYSNSFSFVYQYFKPKMNITKIETYTTMWKIQEGGNYLNFEKDGVIKQYELDKIELYKGIHKIDGEKGDCELHLVHKKNLDFNSNKNQYRKIVDANMYLVIVLRYKNCTVENSACISDNGLLSKLATNLNDFDLNKYPIYQDKRAYLYEGSFLYSPCDENVNYYVINDFFYPNGLDNGLNDTLKNFNLTDFNDIKDRYGRPVLKNFMTYREFLNSKINSINIFCLLIIFELIF
jgi:carbonic anhydrase